MSLSKNEIKFIKALQQKKFRDQHSLFVVEGIKLVAELLNSSNCNITGVYHTNEFDTPIPTNIDSTEISDKDLVRISGLKNPNKVLATVSYFKSTEENKIEDGFILLLDDVKDPGNLGTIIRSADWFGIKEVVCSSTSADVYNPKVVQASMGAMFRSKITYTDLPEYVTRLKAENFTIYAADMKGENAFNTGFKGNSALIMGSESHGVSDDLRAMANLITIPKIGETESLNVSVAAGILMALIAK